MILFVTLASVALGLFSWIGLRNLSAYVRNQKHMKLKPEVDIRNWKVEQYKERLVLWGNVYNHPNFEDGTWVRTSALIETDFDKGRCISQNTIYNLIGETDEE